MKTFTKYFVGSFTVTFIGYIVYRKFLKSESDDMGVNLEDE